MLVAKGQVEEDNMWSYSFPAIIEDPGEEEMFTSTMPLIITSNNNLKSKATLKFVFMNKKEFS